MAVFLLLIRLSNLSERLLHRFDVEPDYLALVADGRVDMADLDAFLFVAARRVAILDGDAVIEQVKGQITLA